VSFVAMGAGSSSAEQGIWTSFANQASSANFQILVFCFFFYLSLSVSSFLTFCLCITLHHSVHFFHIMATADVADFKL